MHSWEDQEFRVRYKIFRDELNRKYRKFDREPESHPDFAYYKEMYKNYHKLKGMSFQSYWEEKMNLKFDYEEQDGKINIWRETRNYVRDQMEKGNYRINNNNIQRIQSISSCSEGSSKRKRETRVTSSSKSPRLEVGNPPRDNLTIDLTEDANDDETQYSAADRETSIDRDHDVSKREFKDLPQAHSTPRKDPTEVSREDKAEPAEDDVSDPTDSITQDRDVRENAFLSQILISILFRKSSSFLMSSNLI